MSWENSALTSPYRGTWLIVEGQYLLVMLAIHFFSYAVTCFLIWVDILCV